MCSAHRKMEVSQMTDPTGKVKRPSTSTYLYYRQMNQPRNCHLWDAVVCVLMKDAPLDSREGEEPQTKI